MRARRAILWVLVAVPAAAILGYIGVVALAISLADQNFDVRRGSAQYYALFGSTIRNVPLIEPAGGPRFHFRGGDGPKPTETIVSYASTAEAARIEAELAKYLVGRGYARRNNNNSPPAEVFAGRSVYFEIATAPQPDKPNRVTVTKYEF
jgi:hypothetical protein